MVPSGNMKSGLQERGTYVSSRCSQENILICRYYKHCKMIYHSIHMKLLWKFIENDYVYRE